MAKYRKLGRTSAQRKALLRNQVTAVINNGKIVTTEAKAKEVQKIVDGLIALAVKEKDNFETVKVTTKVARKDKDGKRVKQIVDKETGKVLAESHRDKDGSEKVSPANASAYADRTSSFPYKIDENDLCYQLFKEHGFTWGGHWNSCKDYQHFQKVVE